MRCKPAASWRTMWRMLRAIPAFAGALGLLAGIQVRGVSTDYREMRYEGVIGQSSDYSCGPAAVATLLTCFYGCGVSEGDILKLTEQYESAAGREPGAGISAFSLKRALADHGVPARGLLVSLDALVRHFEQQGLPLILHTTRPQKHFLVAVAIVGNWFVLADPSWGRRIVRVPDLLLEFGFDGVVLAPMPPTDKAEAAASIQAELRRWAGERLVQLDVLREYMLWP